MIASCAVLCAGFVGCQGKSGANGNNAKLPSWDTTAQYNIQFHLEIQKFNYGYGYVIAINGKNMILQDVIPVIEGYHEFATPDDAFNIGMVAARQMASGMGMPSITFDHLMEYGIIDKNGGLLTASPFNQQ